MATTSATGAAGLVQVLAPDGTAVGEIPRGLSDGDVLSLYRWLVTVRTFDARMVNLQRQGRIAFYGPTTGQEAVSVGCGYAMGPEDWVLPALREQGIALMRGLPLSTYVAQLMGNANDLCKGRQMPCHPTWREGGYVSMSSVIATQVPHAVGVAMAMKIKKTRAVCLGFLGDGATSEGDFHVAMNFAAVFRSPCVIVCQNNHWAITVPLRLQTTTPEIVAKAEAYGMRGVRVDGNDVLAVYQVAREAIERARAGGGPTFVEAVTYRMLGHTTSDDPSRYRDPAEVEPWKARDPIDRMRRWLTGRGLLDAARDAAIEAEIKDAIDRAVKEQEAAGPPAPRTLIEDVFAEPTPELERLGEELEERQG